MAQESHMFLGFVDDIYLIGFDCRTADEAFALLKRKTVRIFLILYSTKTRYMIMGKTYADQGGSNS